MEAGLKQPAALTTDRRVRAQVRDVVLSGTVRAGVQGSQSDGLQAGSRQKARVGQGWAVSSRFVRATTDFAAIQTHIFTQPKIKRPKTTPETR